MSVILFIYLYDFYQSLSPTSDQEVEDEVIFLLLLREIKAVSRTQVHQHNGPIVIFV